MVIRKNEVYLFIILILIVLFPWDYFSPGRFEDLLTYKSYLFKNERHYETLFDAPLIFLFKEIVFQLWLFFIYDFGFEIDVVIFIVALSTVIIFFIACKRLQFDYRVSLLLLCPLMIDFFNSQLRNSLACSLFFLGYSLKNKIYKYVLFAIAFTFHFGVLVLISTYFLIDFINSSTSKKYLRYFALILISFAFAFGDKIFFAILDDYRADVYASGANMSLIYFLWSLALFYSVYILKIKNAINPKELDFAFVGSMLVALAYFSGAYYGRYLAMFFPFLLISMGKFNVKKPLFLIVLFYSVYTFIMNFVFNI